MAFTDHAPAPVPAHVPAHVAAAAPGPLARPTTPVVRRRLAALVGAVLACTGALVPVGPATAGDLVATTGGGTHARSVSTLGSYERQVKKHVNRVRRAHGLRPLRIEGCTDRRAERWARHLAGTGRLVHQSGRSLLSACDARYAAETLGRGSHSPRGLVRAWMRSPGHRSVLLSRQATRIGIGTQATGAARVTAANFTRF